MLPFQNHRSKQTSYVTNVLAIIVSYLHHRLETLAMKKQKDDFGWADLWHRGVGVKLVLSSDVYMIVYFVGMIYMFH